MRSRMFLPVPLGYMKIVEYVAAFGEVREPGRAEFRTIEQLLSLPWVAKHKINRDFTRFSIANGNTLVMEFRERDKPSLKVIGRIFEPDQAVLGELGTWPPP